MKPGIYFDITSEAYHSGPGVSNSQLNELARSAAHFYDRFLKEEDDTEEPAEESKVLATGTAVHCAVLEPDRFAAEYIIAPTDIPKRPTSAQINAKSPSPETVVQIEEWNKWSAEWAEISEGKQVLTATEYKRIQNIAAGVRNHPASRVLLNQGRAEVSVYWEDPDTGVLCRVRPDWLAPTFVFDLKTTEDARPEAFARSIIKYGYYRQAAFYLDGCRANGLDVDSFIYGPIEKSSPFLFSPYFADPDMIEVGRREYKALLETYARCSESGVWPGYSDTIRPITLPAWFKAANDNSPE